MAAGLMDAHMMIMPYVAWRAQTLGWIYRTNIETIPKEVTAAESKDHRPERELVLYFGAGDVEQRTRLLSQSEMEKLDWFITLGERLSRDFKTYDAFIAKRRAEAEAAEKKKGKPPGGNKPKTRG